MGVSVGVPVGVSMGVSVGVSIGVSVGLSVAVSVGASVGVGVGVGLSQSPVAEGTASGPLPIATKLDDGQSSTGRARWTARLSQSKTTYAALRNGKPSDGRATVR